MVLCLAGCYTTQIAICSCSKHLKLTSDDLGGYNVSGSVTSLRVRSAIYHSTHTYVPICTYVPFIHFVAEPFSRGNQVLDLSISHLEVSCISAHWNRKHSTAKRSYTNEGHNIRQVKQLYSNSQFDGNGNNFLPCQCFPSGKADNQSSEVWTELSELSFASSTGSSGTDSAFSSGVSGCSCWNKASTDYSLQPPTAIACLQHVSTCFP